MQSEMIDQIAAALAKAQGEMKNPVRNKTVTVTTKSGGNYKFSYATLDECTNSVRGPLSKNGIGLVNHLEQQDDGKTRLVTKLVHSSGQYLGTSRPLFVTEQTSQALMSAETYARRGNLCDLTGISAEDDDDGNVGDGNTAKAEDRKPPSKAAEALIEAVKQDAVVKSEVENKSNGQDFGPPTQMILAEKPDWLAFAQKMIALSKTPDWPIWRTANMVHMETMKEQAPKVYANMSAQLQKLRENEPKRRGRPPKAKDDPKPLSLKDDPEAYLKWLNDQVGAFTEEADLWEFAKTQGEAIAQGFPSDQAAANDIIRTAAAGIAAQTAPLV